MMYARETYSAKLAAYSVGAGSFKEIDLPISALIMTRLTLTNRPNLS